jgi:hypothetical protein
MTKPLASLSLDLDNKWSYLKTHGDEGWEAFPSYLDVVVPRVLALLAERNLKITFFVVGQDAALQKNRAPLRALVEAGHEIGNHSFHHDPWLHRYSPEEIAVELAQAEQAIQEATGQRPVGFRGPGFSFSPQVLRELADRGYAYDASTFPTFLGPLARMYYFLSTNLSRAQQAERKQLFGNFREGFRPLRPYLWRDLPGELVEIPVTTMPLAKAPIHVSYLLYLAQFSRTLALAYWRLALTMCRAMRVEPSLLLHPLDFLGCDDDGDLAFFPAMNSLASDKIDLVREVIDLLGQQFSIVTMVQHATHAAARLGAAEKPVPAGWQKGSSPLPPAMAIARKL